MLTRDQVGIPQARRSFWTGGRQALWHLPYQYGLRPGPACLSERGWRFPRPVAKRVLLSSERRFPHGPCEIACRWAGHTWQLWPLASPWAANACWQAWRFAGTLWGVQVLWAADCGLGSFPWLELCPRPLHLLGIFIMTFGQLSGSKACPMWVGYVLRSFLLAYGRPTAQSYCWMMQWVILRRDQVRSCHVNCSPPNGSTFATCRCDSLTGVAWFTVSIFYRLLGWLETIPLFRIFQEVDADYAQPPVCRPHDPTANNLIYCYNPLHSDLWINQEWVCVTWHMPAPSQLEIKLVQSRVLICFNAFKSRITEVMRAHDPRMIRTPRIRSSSFGPQELPVLFFHTFPLALQSLNWCGRIAFYRNTRQRLEHSSLGWKNQSYGCWAVKLGSLRSRRMRVNALRYRQGARVFQIWFWIKPSSERGLEGCIKTLQST